MALCIAIRGWLSESKTRLRVIIGGHAVDEQDRGSVAFLLFCRNLAKRVLS
jgi:hypothetical protein